MITTRLDMHPDYESAIRASGLDRFEAFMTIRGGPPTSRHRHRETLPIELKIDEKKRRFFLKRVFKVPPKHAFWPMVRLQRTFSQPAREWEMCRQLKRAGIPVMKAIACGERRRLMIPTQAFLLVEAVPMTHTLEDWLTPGFPRPVPIDAMLRGQLLFDLGALVGKLHAAGFDWPDIDAKHIYAAYNRDGDNAPCWRFCLIDVERMTRGPDRGFRPGEAISDGLLGACRGLLESLVPMRFDRDDASRFWSGVCSVCEVPENGRTHLFHAMGMDRMPRLPDEYVHPRRVSLNQQGDIFADPQMIPWLHVAGVRAMEDVFAHAGGTKMHKPGLGAHRERIRIDLTCENNERQTGYLKRYRRPPFREQLRRLWRHGRKRGTGGIEARFIRRLTTLGIPTMRTIAYGQEMSGLFERRGFILTEEINGLSLEQLTQRIQANSQACPTCQDRREIIRQLAWMTARLHTHRLFHRDLYLCHVFLCRNATGEIVLRLIDLARMIERPRHNRRWIVKDLAALDYSAPPGLITRADRVRFLYDYDPSLKTTRNREERKRRERSVIVAIQARTAKMKRHDVRRARRLGEGTQP